MFLRVKLWCEVSSHVHVFDGDKLTKNFAWVLYDDVSLCC